MIGTDVGDMVRQDFSDCDRLEQLRRRLGIRVSEAWQRAGAVHAIPLDCDPIRTKIAVFQDPDTSVQAFAGRKNRTIVSAGLAKDDDVGEIGDDSRQTIGPGFRRPLEYQAARSAPVHRIPGIEDHAIDDCAARFEYRGQCGSERSKGGGNDKKTPARQAMSTALSCRGKGRGNRWSGKCRCTQPPRYAGPNVICP